MTSPNQTKMIGWHPSQENLDYLQAEIKRRGGGHGVQTQILEEALGLMREDWDFQQARLPPPAPRRKKKTRRRRHA